ncbi:MAG: hypothetical protein GX103_05585 [Bacteroidales bacterium]|nr:hypothetical protein [Bacteroidales bacterium]
MGRSFTYKNETNRLLSHDGRTDVYSYDEHGNTTAMPHLSRIKWRSYICEREPKSQY